MGVKELSKRKKNKKYRNTVSFDEEIVTKNSAVNDLVKSSKILDEGKISQSNHVTPFENSRKEAQINDEINIESNTNANETHSRKKTKRKQGSERNEKPNKEGNVDQNVSTELPNKKRKKNNTSNELEIGPEENKQVEQNSSIETQSKKRKKNKKSNELETGPEENKQMEQSSSAEIQSKKRKKTKKSGDLETKVDLDENQQAIAEKAEAKKEESIRAQKRKKHEKLVEAKRLKAAAVTQQNVLNYLSKWKHARDEWKFEKLKQIWLQQNLFNCSKIPNEFWDTAVDYFNGSKGFIRKCVLRDALKIIEKAESSQEENADENYHLILKRAHDIIQNLQE